MIRYALLFLLTFLLAMRAEAETRALVAGFNTYKSPVRPLFGAVNDADLIEQSLKTIGVRDVTRLPDASTTREQLLKALDDLLGRSSPDDLIIVHFAGHGSRGEDREPFDEADGRDEYFLLPGYNDDDPEPQALRDDELYEFAESAEAKKVRILFVLDTCHSGGLFRQADLRIGDGVSRLYQSQKLPPPVVVKRVKPLSFGDNVAMIAATTEGEKVREFQLDGRMHGALSHVFAGALLNAELDRTGDGSISTAELVSYVEQRVRSLSGNSQDAQFVTPPNGMELFPISSAPVSNTIIELPEVSLHVLNGELPDGALRETSIVTSKGMADLVWDAESGDILTPTGGDIVAHGLDPIKLQNGIEAERARKLLLGLEAAGKPVSVFLNTDTPATANRIYCDGEVLTAMASKVESGHFTAVDITGEGVVQLLFPRAGDSSAWENTRPWTLKAQVTKHGPFGRDTVVLIATDEPLSDLHSAFQKPAYELAAGEFTKHLMWSLQGKKPDVGITSIYTQSHNMAAANSCVQ